MVVVGIVIVPVVVVPVEVVVQVVVVVVPVIVAPVFMTIVILWVTGSMTIWKFPVVSALTGSVKTHAMIAKNIQSTLLFMEIFI